MGKGEREKGKRHAAKKGLEHATRCKAGAYYVACAWTSRPAGARTLPLVFMTDIIIFWALPLVCIILFDIIHTKNTFRPQPSGESIPSRDRNSIMDDWVLVLHICTTIAWWCFPPPTLLWLLTLQQQCPAAIKCIRLWALEIIRAKGLPNKQHPKFRFT